jgi:UDP-N-acetylmuramoyl-L-alanyl-D-glutamate--2,6-diaminopimelate ligase
VPGYPRPRGVHPTPLGDLAEALSAPLPQSARAVPITGVTLSSQSVLPGDLYAALAGSRVHGVAYAAGAVEAGAVAILTDPAGAERAAATGAPVVVVDDPREALGTVASIVYGDPTARLEIIGITGTAGKTSTAYLVEAGLRAAGRVTGLIGTVETRMGGAGAGQSGAVTIDSARTTPEAPDLHALFAVAVEQGVDAVVMEVSSHALQLGRVNGVRFAVGGFTNFGQDHLDFHADLEEYFAAKAKLFDGRSGVEIVNLDDPALRQLVKPDTVTYSAAGDPAATWHATGITPVQYGQTFVAHGPGGSAVAAGVRLPGRHNVANALLAIAALTAVGVAPEIAATAVAGAGGAPGRMERVDAPGPVLGIVDYAHKPDAIVEVLAALRGLVGERGSVICVIGAGGDRDKGKRALMGAAAARGADLVVVTDDNPRTEDPAVIRAQVLAGAGRSGVDGGGAGQSGQSSTAGSAGSAAKIVEVAGRRAAIAEAVRIAAPGDVIALLGKGHERGQEILGETLPFDDRIELANALRDRFEHAPLGA